jgi:hypothetical protein
VGKTQAVFGQANQLSSQDIRSREREPPERNPLSRHGGFRQRVRIGEGVPAISRSSVTPADLNQARHDTLRSISSGSDNIDAGSFRQSPAVEARAAHRKKLLIEKLDGPQAPPIARAEPDRDVDAVGFELGQRLTGLDVQIVSQGGTMPNIDRIRAEIERMRVQVNRQRGEIKQLQRAGTPTASAEALLDRMLNNIDGLCAERDRLKKEQPGPVKGKVLGGRRW